MDRDPSSKDKNQELRTVVLRPLHQNQNFRIQDQGFYDRP